MTKLDKYTGCLIGGAAGDALGYAVEFNMIDEIIDRYGAPGITDYELVSGVAEISDDTQMSLFTAAGLILAEGDNAKGSYIDCIWDAYKEWLNTQKEKYPVVNAKNYTGLLDVPELFARRAPGGTCLSALCKSEGGTLESPINSSKGCGGIMRVAPVGLFFDSSRMDIKKIDRLGAEAAALTHGHSLGWLPAAAFVHIIARIVHENFSVEAAVEDMKISVRAQFGDLPETDISAGSCDKGRNAGPRRYRR